MRMSGMSIVRFVGKIFCIGRRIKVVKDAVREVAIEDEIVASFHGSASMDEVQDNECKQSSARQMVVCFQRTMSSICLDRLISRIEKGRDRRKIVDISQLYLDRLFREPKGVRVPVEIGHLHLERLFHGQRLSDLQLPISKELLRGLSIMDRSAYQRVIYDSGDLVEDRIRIIPAHMLPIEPYHPVPEIREIFAFGKALARDFKLRDLIQASKIDETDKISLKYALEVIRVMFPKQVKTCDVIIKELGK